MSTGTTVGVFIGSIRKESFSRKLTSALIKLAPSDLRFDIIEIGDLPLYNQDYDDEGTPPAAWESFREKVLALDAVFFVTPEYNRSIPAVLKNALDVGSRPFQKSVWGGKPGAIVSISQGAIGGFGANHHLRQALVFLDVPTLQQPEAYVGHVARLFDADGEVTSPETVTFLGGFMLEFSRWIARQNGDRI